MPPRDFDDDYPQAPERAPGVYTRSENRSPNELDMLWSGSKFHKEERSPFIFFVAGFILAAILTSAVFLVLNNKPKTEAPAQTADYLQAPVEDPLQSPVSAVESGSEQPATATTNIPGDDNTPSGSAGRAVPPATTAPTARYKTYVVQSGDNLGSIAVKVYGSSSPEYVDKIQRANNMSSPDKLQLDQELVIPPLN